MNMKVTIEDKDSPPSDKDSVKSDTLKTAMQDITSEMPEVSAHVVEMQQEEKEAQAQSPQPEAVDPTKKKRGRPSKNPNGPTQSRVGSRPSNPQAEIPTQNLDQQRQMAVAVNAAAQLVQVSGFLIAGAEAQFKPEEKLLVEGSFEAYFKAKGVMDIPPAFALAFGLFGYYGRVATTRPAQTKMKMGWLWFKTKTSNFFSGKFKKNASYADSRNDYVGEDNPS